ncbi:unnamed protein product [Adineta ricciae]|uniref:Uncharacterized protein n=1 Tax=Adineta ricciae TaxID=249248 RepID=A0A815ZN13_ADIRI|nr:unnamed protein product [Adineta ricciae]
MELEKKQRKNHLRIRRTKSNYLEGSHDCLTEAFITIYNNSIWCLQSIYEVLFRSFWQVFLLAKGEICYDSIDKMGTIPINIIPMNNSAGENYRYHRLPRSHSQYSREKSNLLFNQTRVTIRPLANVNLNRTPSNPKLIQKEENPSKTLGTINSHITVAPLPSSHCQILTSNDNHSYHPIDLSKLEKIGSREQLADELCRRSCQPLMFTNRGMCCGHCRSTHLPNIVFSQQEKGSREKTPKLSDASDTQSTPYSGLSVSPSLRSPQTQSREENETYEQNQSIFSFPDHDTPLSQQSQDIINDDSQLRLDAEEFVNDSIQNAQEKYQKSLQSSSKSDYKDDTKQTVKLRSKSVVISDELPNEKSTETNNLYQRLCSKLNLSNVNQISEIVDLLAWKAPHLLKEQPVNLSQGLFQNSLKHFKTCRYSFIEKENHLCGQLLLHPPFKPKRLIHLCPDGSIQVLSAIDDQKSYDHNQQYHLNYSNSATNESPLALEYETIAVDPPIDLNHRIIAESTSLQQIQALIKYDNLLEDSPIEIDFEESDPIIKVDLELEDEITEVHSENEENSFPEVFFKRIITPERNHTLRHITDRSSYSTISS